MAAAPAPARPRSIVRLLAAILAVGLAAGGLSACDEPVARGDADATPGAVAGDPARTTAEPAGDATSVLFDPGIDVRPEPVAGPDLGDDTFEPVDEESVVPSPWGLVPNDRLWFLLPEGSTEADAAAVAERMQGTLGGRIEVADLWLVLIPPQSPEGILFALEFAASIPGVDAIFPDVPLVPAADDCAAELGDPVYAGDNAEPYAMIGVDEAWRTWFAAGVQKHPVHVGIVDTALTKSPTTKIAWEFDNVTWVGDPVTTPDYAVDEDTKKPTADGFNHADGVLGIVAGDRTDGGIAGIASPLGGNLLVSHADFTHPPAVTTYDADAVYQRSGQAWTSTLLLDVKRQVESGATIINLSVGTKTNDPTHAGTADMWRRFYEKMAKDHPEVLFVAAAGNNESLVDGHNSGPGGIAAPNVITVGSVQTNEEVTDYSNQQDPSSTDGEVTLFAPGDQAVWGTGRNGKVQASGGGTSSATPMVTATAALIRSVNPKLTAAEIKQLIVETTYGPDFAFDGQQILQVDRALRQAIDDVRVAQGKDPLTDGDLVDAACTLDVAGHIEAMLADPVAAKWLVEAVLPGAEGPTGITLTAAGARPSNWRQAVTGPTQRATWTVLAPKGGIVITVTRLDSGFWKQFRLRDGLEASPTPAPTTKPTPKPTKKPKPTAKPSSGGYDCSKPPPSGSIGYLNWSLHCKQIAP